MRELCDSLRILAFTLNEFGSYLRVLSRGVNDLTNFKRLRYVLRTDCRKTKTKIGSELNYFSRP